MQWLLVNCCVTMKHVNHLYMNLWKLWQLLTDVCICVSNLRPDLLFTFRKSWVLWPVLIPCRRSVSEEKQRLRMPDQVLTRYCLRPQCVHVWGSLLVDVNFTFRPHAAFPGMRMGASLINYGKRGPCAWRSSCDRE